MGWANGNMKSWGGYFAGLGLLLAFMVADVGLAADRPNIVVILADDMGYGDVQALNPESTIPTPNLNRLAREGMTFADAHSPSAVCTPTRYALLTGRYCWRTRLTRGVLGGFSAPLMQPGRQTIATVLRNAGYRTGCVGKWHLGLDWKFTGDKEIAQQDNMGLDPRPGTVDYAAPFEQGPLAFGFDTCTIIPASLDMTPYVYIHDRHVVQPPSRTLPGARFPAFYRGGPAAADFEIDHVLDHLTNAATEFIRQSVGSGQPFFLYFPLSAPHKPVSPHPQFQGAMQLGPYGDFIVEVDDTVGRVLAALEEIGAADDTLLVYTSDNGSFMYRRHVDQADHTDDDTIEGFRPEHHRPNGPWRGTKADVWEAGHRVPFFVRWPGVVSGESVTDQTICHVDLLATLAEVAGTSFDADASPDTYSFHSLLHGNSAEYTRPHVVNHSAGGIFAVREGKWKLVFGNGSGGREKPHGEPFQQPYHLFDLETDPAETTNLVDEHPHVVARLTAALQAIRESQ